MEEKKTNQVESEETVTSETEADSAETQETAEKEENGTVKDNNEDTPEEARKKKYYRNICLFVILPIIAGIISILTGGFLLALIAFGVLIYGAYGVKYSCPKCKGWCSLKEYSRDELGTHTEYQTETKRVNYYEGNRTIGTPMMHSETQEQVAYDVTEFQVNCQCEICGALVAVQERKARRQ